MRRSVVLAVPLVVVAVLAAPALATVYRDPFGIVAVGTNRDDANDAVVAVSEGGCADGTVAVAIGPSYYDCREALGDLAGVGVLGASAVGVVAVSDSGHASGNGSFPFSYRLIPSVAVSGTGSSQGVTAVSVTGDADSYSYGAWPLTTVPAVAASGTGNATGDMIAVSGTGTATTTTPSCPAVAGVPTCTSAAVAGGDATANGGLVAVSVTGNASGALVNLDLE